MSCALSPVSWSESTIEVEVVVKSAIHRPQGALRTLLFGLALLLAIPAETLAANLELELDALGGGPGRAEDLSLKLSRDIGERNNLAADNPDRVRQLDRLRERGVTHIVALPLYPHYSSATTGSGAGSSVQKSG